MVFYGAGEQAGLLFDDLSKKYHPICFCDSDRKKQGTLFMGLPVFSLEEVRQKYPDFSIYLTLHDVNKPQVIGFLLESGITKEQILNYIPVEKYRGCPYIEDLFIFRSDSIVWCCSDFNKCKSPVIKTEKNVAKNVNNFISLRNKIIKELKNSESIPVFSKSCAGCPEIVEKYYKTERKISFVNYTGFSGCQFKCSYCVEIKVPQVNLTDFCETFEFLKEHNYLDKKVWVTLSAGEIAVDPNRDKVIETIKGYNVSIFSNGGIFYDKIEHLLAADSKNSICVSVDAGTRETFKKIKGVDKFNEVRKNLKLYSRSGNGNVVLKYIILDGINDNDADIEGFIELCKETGVRRARVARDSTFKGNYKERTINAVVDLLRKMRENNIVNDTVVGYDSLRDIFNKTDYDRIMERLDRI
ncbi:hypothetical protein AGMMS49942_29700 [Spirochaetia bacterium]|nr:hypothetical protein AGMMS49942_29700 [Spirochaetia bacterium]